MESTVLVKAFAILEAMARRPAGWPLGELATEVGVSKPTVHRILRSLAGLGYIERGGAGTYRRTERVRRLVEDDGEDRLLAAAEQVLRLLHEQTGETVNLGVLRQGRIRYLRVIESPRPLRHVTAPQSTDPAHSTALGCAILGHLPADQRQAILATAPLERRTGKTIIDPDHIARLLEEVRRCGFAVDDEQTDVGVTCMGAPVFRGSEPIAAISVSTPTARLSATVRDRIAQQVRNAARRLSASISRSNRRRSRTTEEKTRATGTSGTRSRPIRRAVRARL